jgi:actin-related protein 9
MNSTSADNPEDEGIVDIAAIVSSGRTREILEERERAKKAGEKKPAEPTNMAREFNSFVDRHGTEHQVGKERFHGTEKLVAKISLAVGEVVKQIDQVNRRQDVWDNLIFIGRGGMIKGLKEELVTSLQNRYLISRPTTYSELPSTLNTGQNTPTTEMIYSQHSSLHQGHGQSPTSIHVAKMADYFPEWKGHGWDDAAFLGAQIAAKQIFTGPVEGKFMPRRSYNDYGPSEIWDV